MKFALASDLYVDCYPDDQQIDWRLVRRWTGADVLVIGGNTSANLERVKQEVLAARECFDRVIFVDGLHERGQGLPVDEGMVLLRDFAERHGGIHYLEGGAGVMIEQTLFCGVAGWQEHQAAMLAQRIAEAAADPEIGEIVAVTHAAPHPDALRSPADEAAAGTLGTVESAALASIWSECLDGGKMTVWCFGHAPHPHDFSDCGVRFVCNPRGRPGTGANMPYSVHLIDTSALTSDMWGDPP
jgi:hypothetical protein